MSRSPRTPATDSPRRLLLSRIGFSCVCAALFCGSPAASAQLPSLRDDTPTAKDVKIPSFDVVSAKENRSSDRSLRFGFTRSGFTCTNVALKDITAMAYGIRQDLISGLPDWASNLRYDIEAKVADDDLPTLKKLSSAQRGEMLVAVLVDRFKMDAHKETRTLPTFDLVVDKGGPKLTPSTEPPPAPSGAAPTPGDRKFPGMISTGPGGFSGTAVTTHRLASQLENAVQRSVTDKTGLTGKYDIDLKWTPMYTPFSAPPSDTDDQTGSIFTALREQLGLKLVSSKGPVETLVVSHVEKPSEN